MKKSTLPNEKLVPIYVTGATHTAMKTLAARKGTKIFEEAEEAFSKHLQKKENRFVC